MTDATKRKRGRPKGTHASPKYTAKLGVHMTPEQLEAVHEHAASIGESASDYVRESLAREMGDGWPR